VAPLNFVGTFGAKLPVDGPGAHPNAQLHVDSVTTHAPAGAIIVPDANLLFTGDFKRSGVDLILSRDDHELVLQDYFKGEKRAALASPDGAHLSGDLVNTLAGHVDYAQANGSVSAATVIGHVTKLTGTATAIRNGVSIILHQGDNVDKGDVVQSGSDSTLGITFIDGTVFGLSSNAKMVLNEMVYDPNGSNNSSLLSLVAGTISFVAGETAKHGDMKVDTPVATMGIRGTAVLVEIDFNVPQGDAPDAKFQVLVEPDGTTGSYILFDKTTLAPIATVNQAGTQTVFSHGVVSFLTTAPLSPDAQKLITEVFTEKFTDNTNVNTKSFEHFTDTLLPQSFTPFILANGATAVPVFLNVPAAEGPAPSGSSGPTNNVQHISQAPTVVSFGGSITERIGVTHSGAADVASGKINFVDVNAGDLPTAKASFTSFAYQNAAHTDVTNSLTALQLKDIGLVEANLAVVAAPGNNNNGSATWTYSVADGAFDFLAAGETLTLTYTAEVDSNYLPNNLATLSTFTVMITGTNDAPVITSGPQVGTITEIAGALNSTKSDKASGVVTFTDDDLSDTHTATLTGVATSGVTSGLTSNTVTLENWLSLGALIDSSNGATGSDTWTFSAQDKNFDYLATGETATLIYTLQIADNQGTTTTQNIDVTITGTNDAPVIVRETDPAIQRILEKSPIILAQGINTNSLGLGTETFDSQSAGSTSNNGFGHGDFVDLDLGATFTGSGNAGVVNGSSAVTAAPFVGPFPGHADTTNYLSIGANGTETITFAAEQNVFGLYWGSVDSYNTIAFYDGAELVASYTGADVSPLFPNGNQGSFSSNAYVEFSDLPTFDKVILATGENAFEIDNISAGFVSHQLDSPITGTLTVSDADIGDTLTASVIGNAIVKYDGWTTLPSDANVAALIDAGAVTFDSVTTNGGLDVLHWNYNPTNSDLDFLTPGHTLTVTFEAQVSDGHVVTGDQPLTVTLVDPDVIIAAGGSSQISSSSVDIVLFADSTGTLVLDNPSSFTGKIGGISGSGDVIDLDGFNAAHDVVVATTGSGSYDGSTGMTSLIVTDQTTSQSVMLNLAGDYSDSTWNVTADGNGGADIVDPPAEPSVTITSRASLGALAIATSGSLEIASAAGSTEVVTFQGSTGSLTLDTPSSFQATVTGFTGDGTLTGSDQIDLKGIDYHSSAFAESFNASTDALSVTDGTDSATLHFAGNYVAANFSFTSDRNGGTIIYDLPVSENPASAPAKAAAPSVANQTGHGFVFNFADGGHDAVLDFRPTTDDHHPLPADAQAAFNVLHDGGHGNTAMVPDGQDPMTLAGIIKAQFHADFHFV